jgi:hypothetical protein
MTPVGVQRRRAPLWAAGRRRPGAPGRFGSEAAPPLFGDGVEAAAVEAPADVRAPDAPQAAAARSPRGRREGATLEELVNGLWEGVLAAEPVACPLCGGELVGRASAHARSTEGRCRDCGTTIG